MEDRQSPNRSILSGGRILIVYALIAAVVLFYAYKLFSYQIINGENYTTRAEDNRSETISLATQRGLIYDRNGVVLARNVPSYNIVITPADLPSDIGAEQEVFRKLSAYIDIQAIAEDPDEEQVRNFTACQNDLAISQVVYIGESLAPFDPVKIKCNVDETTAMVVSEKTAELPGVSVTTEAVRDYPTGELTADVVGFTGPISNLEQDYWESLGFVTNRDKIGYSGVERSMNDVLIGANGERTVEVDNSGQILRDLVAPQEAVPGNSIELTIDVRLQNAARTALTEKMKEFNQQRNEQRYTSGVVIAMNPNTGEVLAMVSYPSYENNRMARIIPSYYYQQLEEDPQTPLLNRAISGEFPPGSVFKMATAIGILNEGLVTPETTIFDPGVIRIEEKYYENETVPRTREYVCYTYKTTGAGHGDVNFLRGVSQSCDVYFYMVGGGYKDEIPEGLGIWRIGEYARALGYGQTLGIELDYEQPAEIPDPNWKRLNVGETWSTGDTYIATIGQGYVLATPLQVLSSVSTIANGGKVMRPTIIHQILDNDGNVIRPFEPDMLWDITKDPVIHVYDENSFLTDETKTVDPYAIQMAQEGMREVVTTGTASTIFDGFTVNGVSIATAGKTGTAEYCDNVAQAKNICIEGKWPAHAWYMGYAPVENPEIAVVAFVYNGDEGSVVAGPIAREVLRAYFELKDIDAGQADDMGS
ncbi:MAG TPA: penicillin-binding protein 2 [Bellilinea sp.]|nr:penicillin-binding protein 2 [Bellilinea sp.]